MADAQVLLRQAYSAFNRRDIDGALALMSDDVNWPRASEGGRAVGKEEIRAYWSRQWKEFDPTVEPMEMIEREVGKTDVRVHQLVKSLQGEVLADGEVWHTFTIANGLIERMDLEEHEAVEGSFFSIFATRMTGVSMRLALRTWIRKTMACLIFGMMIGSVQSSLAASMACPVMLYGGRLDHGAVTLSFMNRGKVPIRRLGLSCVSVQGHKATHFACQAEEGGIFSRHTLQPAL